MTQANPNKVGIVFGALLGGLHLLWSILVLLNWGQWLMDFVFWAHMLQPIYVVGPFSLTAAITLIILTALVGYVLGYIGAKIWNRTHRVQTPASM